MHVIKNWEEYTFYLLIDLKNKNKGKFRSDFFQLHRNDQLRLFNILEDTSRIVFYEYITPAEFAPIFAKLTITNKQSVLKQVDKQYEQGIMKSLPADEVVRFFNKIDKDEINYYLSHFSQERAKQIRSLLDYKAGTAGAMMTTEFVTARPTETVEHVLNRLFKTGKYSETIYYIYIVSETNVLLGVTSLRTLMIVPREHTMNFVMKQQVVSVSTFTDENEIMTLIKEYDLLLLPVINAQRELMGIVTVDDVLDITHLKTQKLRGFNMILPGNILRYLLGGILLSSISFGTIIGFSKISSNTSVIILAYALIISMMGGVISTQTSDTIAKVNVKNNFFKILYDSVRKNNLIIPFIIMIIVTILSNVIVLSIVEYSDHVSISFIIALLLAVMSNVITGTLIPYLLLKFNIDSPNIAIISNVIITSLVSFSLAFYLFL